MSGTLPTVRGAVQALYPVRRTVSCLTDVAIFTNATEQRFKARPPLTNFELAYTRITKADANTMKAFFESQKGEFDKSWSFALGATTFANMTFLDPDFTVREEAGSQTTYSFQIRCRQTANPGQTAAASGGAFPLLGNGLTAQLPYTQIRRFAAQVNDSPAGPRYTYVWFGGGLAGFPTGSLHGWQLEYPVLIDADLATIETHFRANYGRWGSWQFTDPDDNAVYPKCRYDTDDLVITHNMPNQSTLTLRILETN